tara:strand:+ start:331 stop:486 length:156 start_codon:yes stop_codon:yes gene_type:complete
MCKANIPIIKEGILILVALISKTLNIGKYIHDLKLQYKEKDKQVIAKNYHD